MSPTASTATGIQKWTSAIVARQRERGAGCMGGGNDGGQTERPPVPLRAVLGNWRYSNSELMMAVPVSLCPSLCESRTR
jgi:hypothetical protein